MKKISIRWMGVLVACLVGQSAIAANADKNSIFTLGSLHGLFLSSRGYNLRDFIGAINLFRPQVILTEVRSEFPGPLEGSIDGGIEQSIVYAYGKLNGAEVVPVDWFDDDFLKESAQEDTQVIPGLREKALPIAKEYQRQIAIGTIFELHSQSTQSKSKQLHELDEKFGRLTWRKRNEKICKNIQASVNSLHGKRILIIFGLDHKYYIDEFLQKAQTAPVSMQAWLSESMLKKLQVPANLKDLSVENMKKSQSLLKTRLDSGFYKVDQSRLSQKLKEFDRWIDALKSI